MLNVIAKLQKTLMMKRDCGGQSTGNYGLYTLSLKNHCEIVISSLSQWQVCSLHCQVTSLTYLSKLRMWCHEFFVKGNPAYMYIEKFDFRAPCCDGPYYGCISGYKWVLV